MILSIITVSYCDPVGLAATINSLAPQWQSLRDRCEWIVVLGAADDLLDHAVGPEIIIHPPGGIYDAMNAGLCRARGDYVWFLSGGDLAATPDLLPRLCHQLEATHPDILYGDALELEDMPWRKSARPLWRVPFGMITHHPAIIARHALVPGFDTGFRLAADYGWLLACWRAGVDFVYWPVMIAAVARGGQSEQYAADGRAEQARLRHEILGWPRWACYLMRLVQSFSALVRHHLPRLWRWGRRHGRR